MSSLVHLNAEPSYLNVPFDLSQVLFIATANTTATVPPALLDRMELVQISGYTYDEKTHIAMRHLIPKQLGEHGLTSDMINIPEDSIKVIGKWCVDSQQPSEFDQCNV